MKIRVSYWATISKKPHEHMYTLMRAFALPYTITHRFIHETFFRKKNK